jgi:hypothetical protein
MTEQRPLTDDEIEEAIRFANAASAAAGIVVTSPESDKDIREALRGDITFDEAVERAAERAGT